MRLSTENDLKLFELTEKKTNIQFINFLMNKRIIGKKIEYIGMIIDLKC